MSSSDSSNIQDVPVCEGTSNVDIIAEEYSQFEVYVTEETIPEYTLTIDFSVPKKCFQKKHQMLMSLQNNTQK